MNQPIHIYQPVAPNQLTRRGRTTITVGPDVVTPEPPGPGVYGDGITRFGFWAGNVPESTFPATGRGDYDYVKSYLGDPLLKGSYRQFHNINEGVPNGSFVGSKDDYGPPVVTSFKITAQEMLSGNFDAAIRTWVGTFPVNRLIYISWYHEPEDQMEDKAATATTPFVPKQWTTAQYRAGWDHFLTLLPIRETLRPVIILMNYSNFAPHRRDIIDTYVTTNPLLYGLFWDCYLTSNSKTIDNCITIPKRVSDRNGLAFGVCEYAVAAGYNLAGLTHAQTVHKFAQESIPALKAARAEVAQWFESDKEDGNWRIWSYNTAPTDAVSLWRNAVETGG